MVKEQLGNMKPTKLKLQLKASLNSLHSKLIISSYNLCPVGMWETEILPIHRTIPGFFLIDFKIC